jgi:hypothetical protein
MIDGFLTGKVTAFSLAAAWSHPLGEKQEFQ